MADLIETIVPRSIARGFGVDDASSFVRAALKADRSPADAVWILDEVTDVTDDANMGNLGAKIVRAAIKGQWHAETAADMVRRSVNVLDASGIGGGFQAKLIARALRSDHTPESAANLMVKVSTATEQAGLGTFETFRMMKAALKQ